MSLNKKHATICQPYFNTNSCPNGANCILKHIDKQSVDPLHSARTDTVRTFVILPFLNLMQQTIIKPPLIDNVAKLSSNNSNSKCKTRNAHITNHTNLNNFNDKYPSLPKAKNKLNEKKDISIINKLKMEKEDDNMYETKFCSKSKRDCKNTCNKLHGDICDLCLHPVLHPINAQIRREHSQQCVQLHEQKMKEEFATYQSVDKQCSICFENILQKKGDCRFAILPGCNHCFCLVCIKIWRTSAGFGKSVRKSCPECRVVSHYVCPNTFWVKTKEDKEEILQKYKATLAKIDCKYFAKDQKCQFGNKCFYKHCKDGTPVDLGSPRRNRIRNFGQGQRSDFMMTLINMENDIDDDLNSDYNFDLDDSEDSYVNYEFSDDDYDDGNDLSFYI